MTLTTTPHYTLASNTMKKPINQTTTFNPQSKFESMPEEHCIVANHSPLTLKRGTQYLHFYLDLCLAKKSNQQPKLA
jgi:hypothetical protein